MLRPIAVSENTPFEASLCISNLQLTLKLTTFIITNITEKVMKAVWKGQTIAESDQTIEIEGNHYFPADSVNKQYLKQSDHHTTCPWKGEASYYHVEVDGETNQDAAWYYPEPKEGSTEKVGADFTNYIAFWNGIEVS